MRRKEWVVKFMKRKGWIKTCEWGEACHSFWDGLESWRRSCSFSLVSFWRSSFCSASSCWVILICSSNLLFSTFASSYLDESSSWNWSLSLLSWSSTSFVMLSISLAKNSLSLFCSWRALFSSLSWLSSLISEKYDSVEVEGSLPFSLSQRSRSSLTSTWLY